VLSCGLRDVAVVWGCTRWVRRVQVPGMTRARVRRASGSGTVQVAKSAPFWEITR